MCRNTNWNKKEVVFMAIIVSVSITLTLWEPRFFSYQVFALILLPRTAMIHNIDPNRSTKILKDKTITYKILK